MAVLFTEVQTFVPTLKDFLYQYCPDTLEIIRGGTLLGEEHNPKLYTNNSWPMETVVLTYSEGNTKNICIFSTNHSETFVILQSPPLECSAPEKLYISSVYNELGTELMKESFRKPPDILSKYIFSAQPLARPKRSLPMGYSLGSICTTDIDFIASKWPPATYVELEQLMRHFIANYPSAAIYDTSTEPPQPVSWVVSSGLGMLYHLYTHEEHRGKGFGTAVVQELTQKLLAKGIRPATYIRADKKTSHEVFTKCGYVNERSADVVFLYY